MRKSSQSQSAPLSVSKSLPLFEQNFSINPEKGSLNDDALVREAITVSIKRCQLSREQIADRMSYLLGVNVTARMIASFTAKSKELHRWPGAWDRAFCRAVNDDALLQCRAEAAGYKLIRGEEIQLFELGRQYLRRKRADEQTEMLERQLGGVEI
jgi:hypothetical protein